MDINVMEIIRDLSIVWVPVGVLAIWGVWDQAREEKKIRRAKVRAIKRRHAKRQAEAMRGDK